ncbi:hypothetical protein ACEQ8H_002794 [Pleosporales sp. CAS-2024a]
MAALSADMDTSGPRYLASRQQASQIAKAYRQAAQLFLTRRLPEALSTIEPVITPAPPLDDAAPAPAPIATASRGTRVKVWSFYLTFLNAVVELGADDGKHAFGSTRWKQLVTKCRDGSVWDDVVRDGYAGVEADVDADVVVNLATLLLTHCPSQRLNQHKLEIFLAATANPPLDVAAHMQAPASLARRHSQHGTATPRALHTRIKLLELYTLHILPRNDEWHYASEFIAMSGVLDDERKDAFQLALHSLKEERADADAREAKLRQQQLEQMEQRRKDADARRLEQARAEDERRKRDDETRRQPRGSDHRTRPPNQHTMIPLPTARTARQPPAKRPTSPPAGFLDRASHVLAGMQNLLTNTAHQLTANPLALLRTLMFLLVFLFAIGRKDLRDRISRILRAAWDKVRRTVGMGVKVSYI